MPAPREAIITASELINASLLKNSKVGTMGLKDGSAHVVRVFIPRQKGQAPLWIIYGKSIEVVRGLIHEVRDVLGSERILVIDDYNPHKTNLIEEVAIYGAGGPITCNLWTQGTWEGRKAHIGYIVGDGYKPTDDAEDALLGIAACCLGDVDPITARICQEARKALGES